jgi:hypothetical protein
VAGGDRTDSLITGAMEGLTSGVGLTEGEWMRGERAGAAGVRGWVVRRVRARGRWAEWAARESAGVRKREGGLGPETGPAGGEKFPFLFFSFPISKSIFTFFFSIISFFLLNKYLSIFLGCQNILFEVLLTTIVYAYDE